MPTVTPVDAIVAATANLAQALWHNIPAQHLGSTKMQDLKCLHSILHEAAHPLTVTHAPPLCVVPPSAPPPRVVPIHATPLPHATPQPALIPDYDSEEDIPLPYAHSLHHTIPQPSPSPRVSPPATAPPQEGPHLPPALNTPSKSRSITQEAILLPLRLHHPHLSARHMMQCRFPFDFLAAVLNKDTG
eukprot:CCRYP_013731-RA/>CCRYP_013731-RA protein AED:0.41 eAED:0.41 QI:0/-1/0/1/-1/1/1/0/187